MNELNQMSAVNLINGLKNKKFSCLEVMQAYLAQIKKVNPRINAIVQQLDEQQSLAQAKKADLLLAQGKMGHLHGLPVTIKDHLKVTNFIVTRGCVGLKNNVCQEDAAIVTRLKNAGAIIIGITNMPELGPVFESDNDVYGRTNNPYDISKTSGGSSGGEAAILASGGSALGIGSDGGGSIRVPAHFCGIAGIKPTQRLLPCTGNVPTDGGVGMQFYTPGPMARYVEDLELMLPIIAGWDGIDPYTMPMTLSKQHKPINKMRIGYIAANSHTSPTKATMVAMDNAIETLKKVAQDVVEIDFIDIYKMGHFLWENYFYGGDQGNSYVQLLKKLKVEKPSATLQRFLNGARKSPQLDATEMRLRVFEGDQIKMQSLRAMHKQDLDIIICPACATPAKVHGTTQQELNDFTYTMTFNLLGWPATVVRCGSSDTGLPIGLQIVAKPWEDYTSLSVARLLEQELGGFQAPELNF